ncbi:MAG: triose-phosphate isomerase [Actinomycetota bacterium]
MADRTPLIAGNWKMNNDHLEGISLVQQIAYRLEPEDYERSEVAVIPPFTALRSIQTLIDGDKLPMALGAQNCHWEDAGAFTGEVSVGMLSKLNVTYVVCGHSERRALFGDDDATVNRKVRAVIDGGLVPILCVGETLEQREAGDAEAVVDRQLRAGLEGVDDAASVVIAYEPVWAIGTGRTATSEDANAMCGYVREIVTDLAGEEAGETVRIQYGGSVKAGNAAELMGQPHIDGALVGGASLKADDFAVICRHHRG